MPEITLDSALHYWDVSAGWVVCAVNNCTCGAGGEWPHEPHCGTEPMFQIADEDVAEYVVQVHNTLVGAYLEETTLDVH